MWETNQLSQEMKSGVYIIYMPFAKNVWMNELTTVEEQDHFHVEIFVVTNSDQLAFGDEVLYRVDEMIGRIVELVRRLHRHFFELVPFPHRRNRKMEVSLGHIEQEEMSPRMEKQRSLITNRKPDELRLTASKFYNFLQLVDDRPCNGHVVFLSQSHFLVQWDSGIFFQTFHATDGQRMRSRSTVRQHGLEYRLVRLELGRDGRRLEWRRDGTVYRTLPFARQIDRVYADVHFFQEMLTFRWHESTADWIFTMDVLSWENRTAAILSTALAVWRRRNRATAAICCESSELFTSRFDQFIGMFIIARNSVATRETIDAQVHTILPAWLVYFHPHAPERMRSLRPRIGIIGRLWDSFWHDFDGIQFGIQNWMLPFWVIVAFHFEQISTQDVVQDFRLLVIISVRIMIIRNGRRIHAAVIAEFHFVECCGRVCISRPFQKGCRRTSKQHWLHRILRLSLHIFKPNTRTTLNKTDNLCLKIYSGLFTIQHLFILIFWHPKLQDTIYLGTVFLTSCSNTARSSNNRIIHL